MLNFLDFPGILWPILGSLGALGSKNPPLLSQHGSRGLKILRVNRNQLELLSECTDLIVHAIF